MPLSEDDLAEQRSYEIDDTSTYSEECIFVIKPINLPLSIGLSYDTCTGVGTDESDSDSHSDTVPLSPADLAEQADFIKMFEDQSAAVAGAEKATAEKAPAAAAAENAAEKATDKEDAAMVPRAVPASANRKRSFSSLKAGIAAEISAEMAADTDAGIVAAEISAEMAPALTAEEKEQQHKLWRCNCTINPPHTLTSMDVFERLLVFQGDLLTLRRSRPLRLRRLHLLASSRSEAITTMTMVMSVRARCCALLRKRSRRTNSFLRLTSLTLRATAPLTIPRTPRQGMLSATILTTTKVHVPDKMINFVFKI